LWFRASSNIQIKQPTNLLQADHGWKNIHLGFYTETGGCDCSSTVLLMMGKILPETC
jgi:hypothetical protein